MQTVSETVGMLALFNLGGGEIILILLALILFGAKKLPELAKGLGKGMSEFRDELDKMGADAGQSIGGIYGKRAAQALTPDNKVAELYDPAAFERSQQPGGRLMRVIMAFLKLWLWLRNRLGR